MCILFFLTKLEIHNFHERILETKIMKSITKVHNYLGNIPLYPIFRQIDGRLIFFWRIFSWLTGRKGGFSLL